VPVAHATAHMPATEKPCPPFNPTVVYDVLTGVHPVCERLRDVVGGSSPGHRATIRQLQLKVPGKGAGWGLGFGWGNK
jgi:hypothetical protein